jgi:hypothetical protein
MAQYLKEQGQNEKVRVVEISDGVKSLDEAFHRMWEIGSDSKASKPIHHVSINPMKGEWLTDKQVLAIVERLEEKYGYKKFHHQRVIVEHVKDGRQHFHVVWNRVSLQYGTAVWPGLHWKKSKEAAREMEKELGLKQPMQRRKRRRRSKARYKPRHRTRRLATNRYSAIKKLTSQRLIRKPTVPTVGNRRRPILTRLSSRVPIPAPYRPSKPYFPIIKRRRHRKDQNKPDSEKMPIQRSEMTTAELIAWAFETGNYAVLASFGIYIAPDLFEP